jgi:RNA polymerase sigma factor (sigma-70 family)
MEIEGIDISELVDRIINHDQEAFRIFYEQYKHLVKEITGKYLFSVQQFTSNLYDFDDLENEIWWWIINKLPTYDYKKSSMTTFIYMLGKSRALRIRYLSEMKKRCPEESTLSLDSTYGENDDFTIMNILFDPDTTIEDRVISDIYMQDCVYMLSRILEGMKDTHKLVFLHNIYGMTLEQSGNIIGLTRERIRQLRVKIQKRIVASNILEKKVDYERSKVYITTLMSKKTDDDVSDELHVSLHTVKVCRFLLGRTGFYILSDKEMKKATNFDRLEA